MPGEKTHGCIHQHSRHSGTRLLLLPNHGDAQQEDAQTCLWCLGLRRVWICPSSTQRQRTVGGFCKCLFGGPADGWGKSGKKFPAVFSEGRQETCEKESVERAVQVQVMFTSRYFDRLPLAPGANFQAIPKRKSADRDHRAPSLRGSSFTNAKHLLVPREMSVSDTTCRLK